MGLLSTLAESLRSIPPELATLILAALPVAELRGALPVALLAYQMPLGYALLWAIIGNMLPVYFLLIFFERASRWLSSRSPTAKSFFTWLFDRTRRRLADKVARYGHWALTLFVAVPLPVTGAWTGSLAAFVFGLPRKKALIAILMGVVLASLIVTIVTLGVHRALTALFAIS